MKKKQGKKMKRKRRKLKWYIGEKKIDKTREREREKKIKRKLL